MFFLQKDLLKLDIPVDRVLRLHRSLGDAQLALPGFPTQRTTAYLCAYVDETAVRVATILHLKDDHRLAFYLNEEGAVSKRLAPKIIESGIYFAESMGFLLSDLEIGKLPAEKRESLWESLPLRRGVQAPPPPVVAAPLPDAQEMASRRKKFLESFGRFLASL